MPHRHGELNCTAAGDEGTARAEPGGGRIAVGLTVNNAADDIEERLVNLYVVSTDGKLSWELSNLNLN